MNSIDNIITENNICDIDHEIGELKFKSIDEFAYFYNKNYTELLNYARYKLLSNSEILAEEFLSDLILKFIEPRKNDKLPLCVSYSFVNHSQCLSFLKNCIVQIIINHTRSKESKITKIDIQEALGIGGVTYNQGFDDYLYQVLLNLSPSDKVLSKLLIEGYNYQEIGTIFDIPEGTVRSRIHRLRQELKNYRLDK